MGKNIRSWLRRIVGRMWFLHYERGWYYGYGADQQLFTCKECKERGKSVPSLAHHEQCLTGRRERRRRGPPMKTTAARKPISFQPRQAWNKLGAHQNQR